MNNPTNQPHYKKSFFSKIIEFIDKFLGIKNEDYLDNTQADYLMKHFDKAWKSRYRKKR